MSKTITDSSGESIEVFTSEELEQQKEEALEKYKEENPDKSEEMGDLQKELEETKSKQEELQKQLDGELDKDKNFANLRKQKQEAEDRTKNLEKQIDEKVDKAKNEILESNVKGYYEDQLIELAEDDKELKKKIEFHYNRIKDTASTKEEVSKKLRDSWILATAGESRGIGTVFSSGGVSGVKSRTVKNFSPEEKELARKLARAGGLAFTEDDLK